MTLISKSDSININIPQQYHHTSTISSYLNNIIPEQYQHTSTIGWSPLAAAQSKGVLL
jgi:hypothetical protein